MLFVLDLHSTFSRRVLRCVGWRSGDLWSQRKNGAATTAVCRVAGGHVSVSDGCGPCLFLARNRNRFRCSGKCRLLLVVLLRWLWHAMMWCLVEDAGCGTVNKVTIVAGKQHWSVPACQGLYHKFSGCRIKVIGWFINHQRGRTPQQDGGEV